MNKFVILQQLLNIGGQVYWKIIAAIVKYLNYINVSCRSDKNCRQQAIDFLISLIFFNNKRKQNDYEVIFRSTIIDKNHTCDDKQIIK